VADVVPVPGGRTVRPLDSDEVELVPAHRVVVEPDVRPQILNALHGQRRLQAVPERDQPGGLEVPPPSGGELGPSSHDPGGVERGQPQAGGPWVRSPTVRVEDEQPARLAVPTERPDVAPTRGQGMVVAGPGGVEDAEGVPEGGEFGIRGVLQVPPNK